MTDEIQFQREGAWGRITLNRPKALNALTGEMVRAFHRQMIAWAGDVDVKAVMVDGAGDRAFCAGADIRLLRDAARRDAVKSCEFFREEYRNNAAIKHYPKPYVALIDGVTMGGGVGLSVHGGFCIAGDKTLLAMPETGIGLFPDVGGGYFMPRLQGGLGLYYALTGARANAADCMAAGLATHFCPTPKQADLTRALLSAPLGDNAHTDIEAILKQFAADPGEAEINVLRGEIERYFSKPASLDALMEALATGESAFARDTLATLQRMSPTSLKLTFEQMKRGALMAFDDVMIMEFRMVNRVMAGHDFFEGVRAQIIDKDREPRWRPASLGDVSDADIAAYFNSLGARDLILP